MYIFTSTYVRDVYHCGGAAREGRRERAWGSQGGMYYGSQQNAKGGGDGAQLASLRQVPRLLQRILLFAKYIQPL